MLVLFFFFFVIHFALNPFFFTLCLCSTCSFTLSLFTSLLCRFSLKNTLLWKMKLRLLSPISLFPQTRNCGCFLSLSTFCIQNANKETKQTMDTNFNPFRRWMERLFKCERQNERRHRIKTTICLLIPYDVKEVRSLGDQSPEIASYVY